MAPSTRFFESTILFSSTSDMDKDLKKELFLVHKHLKMSMSDILKMTVQDRKTFISLHNIEVEREKREFDRMSGGRR